MHRKSSKNKTRGASRNFILVLLSLTTCKHCKKGYLLRSENIPVPMDIGIPMIMHSLTPKNRKNGLTKIKRKTLKNRKQPRIRYEFTAQKFLV